jgi:methylisocitrate lyase
MVSPGKQFRTLVKTHAPLQVLGTINAYTAMLAEKEGALAIYLSGAGVANACYGLPDIGMTSLLEVLEEARRITDASNLPLLVDIDTGWGASYAVARSIKMLEKARVAAVHIEDQVAQKRCGHRPHKSLVSSVAMGDRLKAALDARVDPDFVIMARTDSYAAEGLEAAIERALYYVSIGTDMIFAEALTTLAEYHQFVVSVPVPILANITEFGKTPLFSCDALRAVGVQLLLYPLSAFRAMSFAACKVYQTILQEGSQTKVLPIMQTREELYEVLGYEKYEALLDTNQEEGYGK